jgi:PII-like signaling protein
MGRIVFLCVLIGSAVPAFAANRFSILQGSTSDSVTHFTVLGHKNENLQFRARPSGRPGLLVPVTNGVSGYEGSDYIVHRLQVTSLSPNVPYLLEILDQSGRLLEQRQFETLDISKPNGRIAVGSCMIRQLHNAYLWSNLSQPENRPDLLMITGDIVYLDRANVLVGRPPENGLQVWDEFVKSRQTVGLYFWDKLVPTLTVWDDHDSGGDNVDSAFRLMPEIRKIYDVFQANDEIPGFLEHGPGMAKSFRLFGKNFILLDGRSFRNAWISHPLFGDEQERWMLRQVQAGPNILVSGTQFFGGPIQKDSYEFNWPQQMKSFMEILRRHGEWKNAAFAFITGDVHFSEVEDIEADWLGYPTVEITSSNIHSFGFPGHYVFKPDNPRRRVVTGTHNIVLLDFFPTRAPFEFGVRSMGWRGNTLFQTVTSVDAPMLRRTANEPLPLSACERRLLP